MAQTGYSPISLYYSSTASATPTNTNLVNGELAINITDGKLFYKDNAGTVQTLATKAATSGSFSTTTISTSETLSYGTANGVAYLNGSKVVTTGSALTFDGTTFKNTAGGAAFSGVIGAGVSASASGRFRAFNSTNDRFVEIFNDGTVSVINSTYGSAGASPLTFQITDSEQMRLTSTGLGIGTTSPSSKLVVSNAGAQGLEVQPGAITYLFAYNRNTSAYSPLDISGDYLRFSTGTGAERMRLDSSGNLGIGTSSPSEKLTVAGAGLFTGALANYRTSSAAIDWFNGITRIWGFGANSSTAGTVQLLTSSNNGSVINTLTYDSSGNLGIGTSSPSYKLDVIGQTRIQPASGYNFFFQNSGTTARINYLNDAFSANISAAYRATDYSWQKGDGSEVLKLDSSGNLGLGVTPSSWATYKALQVGQVGALWANPSGTDVYWSANYYFGSGSDRYIANGLASYYRQSAGVHSWGIAPSGTAGNAITFTQAMTLDASGNLGVGTTSPTWMVSVRKDSAGGSSGQYPVVQINNANASGYAALYLNDSAAQAGLETRRDTAHLGFYAGGTERARIDSSGNLGIGTTSPSVILDVQSASPIVKATATTGTNTASFRVVNTGGTSYFARDSSTGGFTGTAYATFVWGSGAYPMVFATNDIERARIDSSGNLLVGTTSKPGGFANENVTAFACGGSSNEAAFPVFTNASTTNAALYIARRSAASTTYVNFATQGSTTGSITTNGTTTSYNTSSDYRLKHDIAPMTGALAKVAALKPVTYKWNADNSDGEGFIAHELAEVVPQCVTGEKDAVDAEGNPVYQGIDTSFLVATLTAAIQELKAEFDAYKATHP